MESLDSLTQSQSDLALKHDGTSAEFKLSSANLDNNCFYSEKFRDLILHLQSDQIMSDYRVCLNSESVSEYMRDYEYALAPWPLVISKDIISQFEQFISPLKDLLYRAIFTFFGEDAQKFADYLDESPIVYALLKEMSITKQDLVIRHDAVFSKNGLKLLDINVGSSIGGWQHDWISSIYDEALTLSDKTADWEVEYRPVIDKVFSSLCSRIKQHNPSAQGNILVYESSDVPIDYKSLKEGFLRCYKQVSTFKSGELLFFNDYKKLEFLADGSLQYQGKRIDAFLLPLPFGNTVPQAIYTRLMTCFISNNLLLPDNQFYTLLGNKQLFALLHEDEVLQQLDDTDVSYIKRFIPWTAKMNKKIVSWQGVNMPLTDLLTSQKENFVIKKAKSAQGKDVYVGRYTDIGEWSQVVAKLQHESGWIAQEYCEPDSVVACNENAELGLYKPVWGIFDINDEYSGSFVRASAINQGNGIINSASGAIEFLVYEETNNYKNNMNLQDLGN